MTAASAPCACPTCGAPMAQAPLAALLAACSPQQADILRLIAEQPGVSAYAIQRALGLPKSGTQLRRLRARLAPFGWSVERPRGARRGYCLSPLADAAASPSSSMGASE